MKCIKDFKRVEKYEKALAELKIKNTA